MNHERKIMTASCLLGASMFLAGCIFGPGPGGDDNPKPCKAVDDHNWGANIMTVVNLPVCPQQLTSHGQNRTYSLQLKGSVSQFLPATSIKVTRNFVKNQEGNTVASLIENIWVQDFHPDTASNQPGRSYPAGSAEAMTGADTLLIESETVSAGLLKAHMDMQYEHPPNVSMSGPTFVYPYGYVTINTSVSQYQSPLTYSWKRNGSPIAGTGSSITNWVGGEGLYWYEVTVTDAEGDWKTKSHSVDVLPCPLFC